MDQGALSLSELRSALVALGVDTSTPDITGSLRYQELYRRLENSKIQVPFRQQQIDNNIDERLQALTMTQLRQLCTDLHVNSVTVGIQGAERFKKLVCRISSAATTNSDIFDSLLSKLDTLSPVVENKIQSKPDNNNDKEVEVVENSLSAFINNSISNKQKVTVTPSIVVSQPKPPITPVAIDEPQSSLSLFIQTAVAQGQHYVAEDDDDDANDGGNVNEIESSTSYESQSLRRQAHVMTDLTLARRCLEEALSLSPNSSSCAEDLAVCIYKDRKHSHHFDSDMSRVESLFNQSIQGRVQANKDDENWRCYMNYASFKFKIRGDVDESIRLYKSSIMHSGDNINVKSYLGLANVLYKGLGEEDEPDNLYRHVLSLDPMNLSGLLAYLSFLLSRHDHHHEFINRAKILIHTAEMVEEFNPQLVLLKLKFFEKSKTFNIFEVEQILAKAMELHPNHSKLRKKYAKYF